MSRAGDMDEFRVVRINLDEDENVFGVRVRASYRALQVMRELIGKVEVHQARQGADDTHVFVILPLFQMRQLKATTGKIRGDDPRSAVTGRMYDSMSMVLYSLVDTD